MEKKKVPVTLRLPDDLHEKVAESAESDSRSLNAQIAVLLREALAVRQAKQEGRR